MPRQLHMDISRMISRAARINDESQALVDECRLTIAALEQTVTDGRLRRDARAAVRRRRGAPAFGNGQADARVRPRPG